MQLPLEDVDLFFRLHRSLMFFVNRKLRVLDQKVATPEAARACRRRPGSRSTRPSSTTWT